MADGKLLPYLDIPFQHGSPKILKAMRRPAAVAAAGWGLLAVTAFHLIPMAADTIAWRYLLEPETRPGFYKLLWMRWIGESVVVKTF